MPGAGYLADYGVERNLRDVRVMQVRTLISSVCTRSAEVSRCDDAQILEGTNEIMRTILARDILPRE